MLNQETIHKHRLLVKALYKNRFGDPFALTDGQAEIFHAIITPNIGRVAIRAVTQYGKSDVASMGLVELATSRSEKILIVAPNEKQAAIIMQYVIGHLFDHPYLTGMIVYEGSLERLKSERSKNRITFRNNSEIFILTAEAGTLSKEGKNLMGFGATVVVADESSLIPDSIWAKVFRMVGGFERGKLAQLGNPFYRNHFWRAFQDSRYHKIIINDEQALKEGRITREFLDEAKENMTPLDYLIFYKCEFPEAGAEDTLIPPSWVELAVNNQVAPDGENRSGLDVARFGNDRTVYVNRRGNKVRRIEATSHMDTMGVVGWASRLLDEDGRPPLNVDVVGIGAGVYDRLAEQGWDVTAINAGESPTTDEAKRKFYNLRAEMYWDLRSQFQPSEGKSFVSIPDDKELKEELSQTRYGYSSDRKIKVEGKEEIKKRLGRSPDKADALALAFFNYVKIEPELIIV